ncbi:serine hydrolase domain-containing protein [Actinoplanes sp. NPDC051861]|uniref:serine hydrolase domain-containing protein n=1 Tax=Actinoplanes sp. NPDC051861 TaxID=3155170 RepID=UPI00341A8925
MFKRSAIAAAVAAALAVSAIAPPASAAGANPVKQELSQLVSEHGFPGALATVTGRDGRVRKLTAGVGELGTAKPVPADGQVRIGSNTKTFVAVVVLQLVGERRVRLDAPVERYLPGLLPDKTITVRQLLQHTSGLPNYTEYLNIDDLSLRYKHFEARELVDIALAHPATFPPGTGWAYSNTNYTVAGLLIEKVTGRSVASEIDKRVLRRIGLRHTYFPAPYETGIRERHPHGYLFDAEGKPLDITDLDPSWGGAAGQMIGTPSDLNRLFTALLDGKLLRPAELAEMQRTVPADLWPGVRYGLGIISIPLSCGGLAWGHGGDIPGYETRGGATTDGRAATVAVTTLPTDEEKAMAVIDTVDTALCS